MRGRHGIGQVFAKGNFRLGKRHCSDSDLCCRSLAAAASYHRASWSETWSGCFFLVGFLCDQHTSLTAAVGNGRRGGLGGGSGTGPAGTRPAAVQGSTPRTTSSKCRLEAGEVCSKGFMENYILRKNSRQRENSSSAKGQRKFFQFRNGSTKDSKL